MISTDVFEPDKNNIYKCVYYRDSKGRTLRKLLLDDFGTVIKDFLYERCERGLIVYVALYGKDHITLIGERTYQYFVESSRCKLTEDCIFENGQKIMIRKAVHNYDDQNRTNRVDLYGRDDKFFGYQVYGYIGDDDFMSLIGCFDKSDNRVSCLSLEDEKIF